MAAMMDAFVAREESSQKSERVAVRLTPAVKRELERAAEVTGRSLSDFVVSSALSAAQKAIEQHERFRLAEADREVFLAALANPPAPNEALRTAAKRHRRLRGA